MNNGPVEEAGKVASTAFEAMKTSPLAIALLLVNIGFLLFCGYIAFEATRNTRTREVQHNELVLTLLRQCQPRTLESKPD